MAETLVLFKTTRDSKTTWLYRLLVVSYFREFRFNCHETLQHYEPNAIYNYTFYRFPSRNLGPPKNALAAYSLCKCTSRHSRSTSSKTIREIGCQWVHSVRSSSLPIEHPKPLFDHKSLLTWPSVTFCRFPLANITLHNLLLIATILHDLVWMVTGWHQPPNPMWNPNKLLTDRKKMCPKIIEKHLFSHMQWISWFFE